MAATQLTVGAPIARLVHTATQHVGVHRAELERLPGLAPAALANDGLRVPTPSVARMWELLAWSDPEHGTGLRMAQAGVGALGLWDYVGVHSPTLPDVLRNAIRHRFVIADPRTQGNVLVREDGSVTLSWRGAIDWADAAALNHEFVLGRMLWMVRQAAGAPIAPQQVSLAYPAPRRHYQLAAAWGTSTLEFEAEQCALTFSAADMNRVPRGVDPVLGNLLRGNIAVLAASAPSSVLAWPDRFRSTLREAVTADPAGLSLDAVAARLALSPRTLQRRLAEHGTTWREEVDRVRYESASRLLRADDRTVQSVAAGVGFADARSLRKAFRRWGAAAPVAQRRTLARADRSASSADLGAGGAGT